MGTLVDTKQLKSLIKLLKAQGVIEYSYEGLTLKLETKSQPRGYKSVTQQDLQGQEILPRLSEEELLFWSSSSIPEEKQTE